MTYLLLAFAVVVCVCMYGYNKQEGNTAQAWIFLILACALIGVIAGVADATP